MNSAIRTDVFPAQVILTPPLQGQEDERQVFEKVRIIITLDAVYVFKDSSQGPVIAFQERLASYDPGVPIHRRRRGLPQRAPLAVTDSGIQVSFARASGCGCGSRLKSFAPFSSINLLAAVSDR